MILPFGHNASLSILLCLIPECGIDLMFHPPLLPPHLGSFTSPYIRLGVMFRPSACAHVVLALPLKYQQYYYGYRQQSVFPTDHHLMMPSPLPCLLASKDTGSSRCVTFLEDPF